MSKIWDRTWKVIAEELKRCKLLCAFCHRDIHKNDRAKTNTQIVKV